MPKRFLVVAFLAGCSSGGGTPATDAGPPDGYVPGGPVTVTVGSAFPAGTAVRDQYGGATATVASDGTVTMTPGASGVVLLEKDGAAAADFNWADVTVYNVMVDRYVNGDPSNDHSYGRQGDGQMEVGTWHGGDWVGLTSKMDYIAGLGVTALWITPIVEQVHGWVSGGTLGDFKYYGYHGYWALDYTLLDKSYGSEAELGALIDAAHQRGIRVLADVVMNHPGYATGADLLTYLPEVFSDGTGAAFMAFDANATAHYDMWNNLVNYNSLNWKNWWSPTWIRAGFPGFPVGGNDDLTKQLSFLPDFITEGTQAADEPVLFTRKTDTAFVATADTTVRQYLVKWHTDWVRKLGIDGFRCDTAKNVELASWAALKDAGTAALAEWKTANPGKAIDDAPFWMVAEVFPHGVVQDSYYGQGKFDSVINFDFQRNVTSFLQANTQIGAGGDALDAIYAPQAHAIAGDPSFGILSYMSSHDTRLNFTQFGNDAAKQRDAGTVLLLAPGGVEIYYGDESGRQAGPALSDSIQATRSDMNFATTDTTILDHWQKVGAFRKKHAAVGAGTHARLTSTPGTYAFSRKLGDDAVVVILAPTQ
jgi:alpha-amylase